ncbi:hypothetical protein JL101_027845 [Skermanella rosea]|uniref:hypothetical protein n=1 Tax=Skermanella rosea TaxID=1817965 RepID=UPI0019312B33|nr:hypothetical protein [Skermanella rosea]UEM03716.1 hypothetical protein JL101_027845 [Skermanella rosea]
MEATGAPGKTLVHLEHSRSLPDPRRRGKVAYPLDDLTVRRSYPAKGKKAVIPMVSAFAARRHLVLGQVEEGTGSAFPKYHLAG